MALWDKEKADNAADYNDSKPNWLSDEEKKRCFCDDRGWVLVHLNGREEVLVAASSLNDPTDNTLRDVGEKDAAKLAAEDQRTGDVDGDDIPNYMDPDIDGDGIVNSEDKLPYDSSLE